MSTKETIKKILDAVAPQIEVAAEGLIIAKSDIAVDFLLGKLTELIPGNIDNAVAASVAPKLKEELKAYLLAQAEKISDKV